ncbi:hypothetical protein AWR38_17710 [Idiomarina sp. WRN-38]|jgi:hypothetical protein|nr:hypothetical protein AUR68_17690 [Idiomarina sp. H105]OAE97654.1 hypothetical protein AWR38_17710 [Idiomarina sp. WRN-38]
MLVVIWRDQSTGYATLSTALHTQELSLTPKIPELKLNLFAEILVFHKKGQLMADLLNSCQD